jgi:hypothetical protein
MIPQLPLGGFGRVAAAPVGWTLMIPQLPLGGFGRVAAAPVGWTLTIPQLPLGGFQAQGQMDKVEYESVTAYIGAVV